MSSLKTVMQNGKKLVIRQFKLNQLSQSEDLPAIIMVAPRGCGKTVLVQTILNYFKDIPVGLIISPTDRMTHTYSSFFPDLFIFYNYRDETMKKLLERQTKMIEKCREYNKKGKSVDPRCFLIMDDCLADAKNWEKETSVKEILFNGRHYKIAYLLTMQYPLGIHPQLRSNFDYIFLFYEDKNNMLKKYYDHYAGIFPTFDSFKETFMKLTKEKGTAMVIVNKSDVKDFSNKVFWFKAPFPVPRIKVGCNQFWQYNKKNYNIQWKEKERMLEKENYENVVFGKNGKDNRIIKIEKVNDKKYYDPKMNYKNKFIKNYDDEAF